MLVPVPLFTACDKEEDDNAGNDLKTERIYLGTAKTQAQSVDVFQRPIVQQYQRQVLITISAPLQAQVAKQVENNPFHIRLEPSSAAAFQEEGQYSILSAGISFQGSLSSELLVQYWTLTRNGTAIGGSLVNPQNALAVSANLINLPYALPGGIFTPFVYAMAQGTSFTGTMTDQEIRIQVQGNAIDGAHPFVSEVVAVRTK